MVNGPPEGEESEDVQGAEEALAEWERQRLRRRRRRAYVFGFLLAGLVLYLATGALPAWMIGKASERATDCFNEIYETGAGEAADCESWWLFYPRLVPWKRGEATQEKVDIESRVAEYAMNLAALRDLDRAARDRAAERLVALDSGSPPPSDQFFNTFGRLRDAGAYEIMARSSHRAGSGIERKMAIGAAMLLGKIKTLRAVAAAESGPEPGVAEMTKVGALRCLFGDAEGGIKALAGAERAYADAVNGTAKSPGRRLAIIACGGTEGDVGFASTDLPEVYQPYVKLVAGDVGEAEGFRHGSRRDRLAALALWLEGRGPEPKEEELRRALELLAPPYDEPAGPSVYALLTHWSVFDLPPSLGPEIPSPAAALASGAEQLSTWAAAVPEKVEPEFGSDEYWSWRKIRAADWAKGAPRDALHWGAFAMSIEAAFEYARRGQLEAAAAALARCEAITAERTGALRPFIAVLAAAIHGPEEGLERLDALLTDSWRKEAEPDFLALLVQERALLLADLGRFDEAFEEADAAYQAARAGEETRFLRGASLRPTTAWLRAALALRTDRHEAVELPGPPSKLEVDSTPEELLGYWWHAATSPPADRAVLRWRSGGNSRLATASLQRVAPAAIYLLGAAAGDGDVELWLDAVLSGWHAISGVDLIAARAAAARWRGDEGAAAEWEQRLDALRSLASDDRGQFLLYHATHQ